MLEFKVKVDGVEKTFKVKRPGLEESRIGQKEYNTAYKNALASGAILRLKLEHVLKEQGLWTDNDQLKYIELTEQIKSLTYQLKQKGMKLNDAKKIALKIIDLREEVKDLRKNWLVIDSNTAESQSENSQFNAMLAACVLNEDGSKVFANLDEYLSSPHIELTTVAANKFMELQYGVSASVDSTPEYKFLKKYKFINNDLRLINKDGELVDRDGKRVDEFGNYIDNDGNIVDDKGRKLSEDGEYLENKESCFLDDDGNPILDEVEEEENVVESPQTPEIQQVE